MTRPYAFSTAAVLTVALLAPPVAAEPPPDFESPLHADHPLVGEIRRVGDGARLEPEPLAGALADADYILLGEQHDNPDHHALQAWTVRALAARGRRPAVAFEMIGRDRAEALSDYLKTHPRDASGLGAAVNWTERGWPDWAMYQPIAEAALDHDLPVVTADAERGTIRRVGRQGPTALTPEERGVLALQEPLPEAQRAALEAELKASHCDLLPDKALGPMAEVQRLRDAVLADSLIRATRTADGAVLIAGGGHVRGDRGVPWYLRARLEAPEIAVVRFMEVRPGETDWSAYLPETPDGAAAVFDYLWFTPAVDRGDPCADLAERMKQQPSEE